MIKLFSVKQKQKENSANGRPINKQSAGELRVQKDISELNLAKTTSISFPNGKDKLLDFEITIRPDEGFYQCILTKHQRSNARQRFIIQI